MSTATVLKTPPAAARPSTDLRRITENDPDYQRLHATTVGRLTRSLKQYIREEQRGDQGADSRFINRHITLMKQAYIAAHREGQKDYWPGVSNRTVQHRFIQPDEQQTQKRLTYYALGSVLKLAHQVKSYIAQQKNGTLSSLGEPENPFVVKLYNPNHDTHGRFTTGSGGFNKGNTPEERAAAHERVTRAAARAQAADVQLTHETQRILQAGGSRTSAGGRIADEFRDARYNAAAQEMDSSLNSLRTAYSNMDAMHSAEETDETSRQIFGRALSEDEYRSLVGAPKNADVTVSTDGERLLIHTEGNAGKSATFYNDREVYKQGDNIVLHNDYFMIDGKTGKGFGSAVFANQVDGAKALGVSKIVTLAAREEGVFNGYYTWPRLGYDGSLSRSFRDSLKGTPFEGHTRVSQFMKTSGGRNFWKAFGEQMNMTFSLKDGSRSLRTLRYYRAAKAAAKGGK